MNTDHFSREEIEAWLDSRHFEQFTESIAEKTGKPLDAVEGQVRSDIETGHLYFNSEGQLQADKAINNHG